MLAHEQGGIMNASKLATNLGVSSPTVKSYVDLLEDLLLIRSLSPWSGNVGKRLVKSPKKYIRDSGLSHALLNITTMDDLLGHPVVGHIWEGFVIENVVTCLPVGATSWFYRTSSGAEIDLILELSPQKRIAIEIKRSSAPTVSKGFHLGCEDIEADERYVVYPGSERFPLGYKVQAISLLEMMQRLSNSK
jgi:uncharacterized protein